MAGDTAGRKNVVNGEAARIWRRGKMGYTKRTSLWEIRESISVTITQVAANWCLMLLVNSELLVKVGWLSGGKRP